MVEPTLLDRQRLIKQSKDRAPATIPPDEPPIAPSRLIHNERQKLIANFYDRAATAALTVGIFGPVSTSLYQLAGGGQLPFGVWFVILFAIFWTSLALFLHFQARHTLGNLRE